MNNITDELNEINGLYNKLIEYSQSNIYPFHMPGHKRNTNIINMVNPYGIDITEVDGFDNLHNAKEVLFELMIRISKYYQTDYSFLLVNGSSCGLLTAISSVANIGDDVIVARNCHKSVYNALFLRCLNAKFIMPEIDEYGICKAINSSDIENVLKENENAKAVIITSPTYEGNVSDIKAISEIVHKYNKILIVDEAHGAHFGKNSYFPISAYHLGADIVIQSIHKTLPAMTQTAIMHINSERVSIDKIRKYLSIYQSSSPSYVLMASVDRCFSLLECKGEVLFDKYVKLLEMARKKLANLKNMGLYDDKFYEKVSYDRGKIVIVIKDKRVTGKQLYDVLLAQYKIQLEMCENRYVIAMTSICDTTEGFDRLINALLFIDKNWDDIFDSKDINIASDIFENDGKKDSMLNKKSKKLNILPDVVIPSYMVDNPDITNKKVCQQLNWNKRWVNIREAINYISVEYVYVYPPGIPIVVPGERVDERLVDLIEGYVNKGLNVIGLNEDNTKMYVMD